MLGFFMALATAIKAVRDKATEQRENYNRQKRKLMRQLKDTSGVDDVPIPDIDEDGKTSRLDKTKTKVLGIISAVILFFELLPLFSAFMIWGLLVFCFIVVVVVIFTFLAMIQAFLKEQKMFEYTPEGMCGKPATSQVASGGILEWTDAELASKGAKLTDNEKNMYKMGVVARKAIEGYGRPLITLNELSLSQKVYFILGVSSTETSMNIYGNTKGDVYKDVSTVAANGKGYGFMGVNSKFTLNTYYDANVVDKIKNTYKPSSTPPYASAFPPYAVAMSTKHHQNDLTANVARRADFIESVAKKYGIVKNKNEFIGVTKMFLAQAHYHGAILKDYEGLVGFWAMLFLESSPDDATRSFSNWALEDTAVTDYSESGIRNTYLGSGGYSAMHLVSTPDKLKRSGNTRLVLNGKVIEDTLWGYLWKKRSNEQGMQDAWRDVKKYSSYGAGGEGDRPLNFHYGLNSYLQALRIEKKLSAKMGIVGSTGDVSTTVPASEASTEPSENCPPSKDSAPVQVGTFKETPGKGQAIVNGLPFDEWVKGQVSSGKIPSSYYQKMKPTIGTSSQLAGTHLRARGLAYKDRVFGVPHYGQSIYFAEKYGQLHWHFAGGDTFNWSGCMVYSHAYAASALTGRMINPAEMGIIMTSTGGLGASGTKRSAVANAHKALGLKTGYVEYGPSALPLASQGKGVGKDIPSTLKAGGVAVIRVTHGKLTSIANHFFVLTSVETKNGVDYYSNYNSVDVGMSMRKLTRDDILRGVLHDEAVMIYK